MSSGPREALRAFLRERRARIAPETVGLPPRRRGSGLRREDVAELLDVTPLWYALFESGSAGRRVSAEFLERLARALRLDDVERDLLLRLVIAVDGVAPDVRAAWEASRSFAWIPQVAETARQLARERDLGAAVDLVCSRMLRWYRSAEPTATLLIRCDEQLEAAHYAGRADARTIVGRRFPLAAAAGFQEVAASGLRTVVVHDLSTDDGLPKAIHSIQSVYFAHVYDGARSLMLVPVVAPLLVGVLRVDSPYAGAFTAAEAELGRTVGAELGNAFGENAVRDSRRFHRAQDVGPRATG